MIFRRVFRMSLRRFKKYIPAAIFAAAAAIIIILVLVLSGGKNTGGDPAATNGQGYTIASDGETTYYYATDGQGGEIAVETDENGNDILVYTDTDGSVVEKIPLETEKSGKPIIPKAASASPKDSETWNTKWDTIIDSESISSDTSDLHGSDTETETVTVDTGTESAVPSSDTETSTVTDTDTQADATTENEWGDGYYPGWF